MGESQQTNRKSEGENVKPDRNDMNANNDHKTTSPIAGPMVAIVGIVGVLAVAAVLLFGLDTDDSDPQREQQASETSEQAATTPVPDALPFAEEVNPCSLTLHDALASHAAIADGFQAWSDHLHAVAGSAPSDVAAAFDELAVTYAALADAESGSLSETAGEAIESTADPASAALIESYLVTNCG